MPDRNIQKLIAKRAAYKWFRELGDNEKDAVLEYMALDEEKKIFITHSLLEEQKQNAKKY